MTWLVESGWEVADVTDGESSFRSLHLLLPGSATLVFECCGFAPDVRDLLRAAAIAPRRLVPLGTAFPRSEVFHVPASVSFLGAFADLAATHAEPELCDHLHAYDDDRHLVQWYDAFDLPLFVDGSITEDAIRAFSDAVGASYGPWRAE
jgi:hypothetical protein